jgi:hypothetical protein
MHTKSWPKFMNETDRFDDSGTAGAATLRLILKKQRVKVWIQLFHVSVTTMFRHYYLRVP